LKKDFYRQLSKSYITKKRKVEKMWGVAGRTGEQTLNVGSKLEIKLNSFKGT